MYFCNIYLYVYVYVLYIYIHVFNHTYKILPNVKYSYLFALKTITIIVTKFKNNSACC